MTIIAIDPGKGGGIAVYNKKGQSLPYVKVSPMPDEVGK